MKTRTRYDEVINEPQLEERLRRRYKAHIQQLKSLGFEEYGVVQETTVPRGWWMLSLPLVPIMWLSGEVIRYGPALSLIGYQPVLTCDMYATYAMVFGPGIKFGTMFRDGTALETTGYTAHGTVVRPEKHFYRYEIVASLPKVLEQHLEHIRRLEANGLVVSEPLNFKDFVRIVRLEDEVILGFVAAAEKSAEA